jgi:hypothetical protein
MDSESYLLRLVAMHGVSALHSWLVTWVEMRDRIDSGCLARRLLMRVPFYNFNDQVATIWFWVQVLDVIPVEYCVFILDSEHLRFLKDDRVVVGDRLPCLP